MDHREKDYVTNVIGYLMHFGNLVEGGFKVRLDHPCFMDCFAKHVISSYVD